MHLLLLLLLLIFLPGGIDNLYICRDYTHSIIGSTFLLRINVCSKPNARTPVQWRETDAQPYLYKALHESKIWTKRGFVSLFECSQSRVHPSSRKIDTKSYHTRSENSELYNSDPATLGS